MGKITKVITILTVLSVLFLGCFNENRTDKAIGVEIIRNGENISIVSEGNYYGEEILLEGNFSEKEIKTSEKLMTVIKNEDGKTKIAVTKGDGEITKDELLFEIKTVEAVSVKLLDGVDKIRFDISKKSISRAVSGNVLLGDFNNDSIVSMLDFAEFKSIYGKTSLTTNDQKYDIAPAQISKTVGWTDIYSISSPDNKINIIDFIIFAKNFGKSLPVEATPTSITITGINSIDKGTSTTLTATITYSDFTTKTTGATWASSDSNIATVDTSGVVNGKAPGTVKITASVGSVTKSFDLTVKDIVIVKVPTSVSISGGVSVAKGATLALTATVTYNDASTDSVGVTWSSSDSTVATVDTNGVVTGIKAGTTNITASKGTISSTAKTITITEPFVSGIKVYFKKPADWAGAYIHYWNAVGTSPASTTWATCPAMVDEGDGWFSYTIKDATSTNLLFKDKAGDTTIKTADQTGVKSGEHWLEGAGATMSDTDPRNKIPVVSATPGTGKYKTAQSVVLSTGNSTDKIYYTKDGTAPTEISTLYTGPIAIPAPTMLLTIKAMGINSKGLKGEASTFTYTVDETIDDIPPVATASVPSGTYKTDQSVTITITDDKDSAPIAYFTTDDTTPTTVSPKYTGQIITITAAEKRKNINVLAVDKSGNQKQYSFGYYIGELKTTRFDPRQESIYFLLTARWFDGDTANSVGDQNCSYTPIRGANTSNGFTGPDDVSWRGDFKGLVEKLDYIKALGFTTIWITPIVQNRSPLSYHGYHAWDFTREDPRLESPGYGFKRVIDEAHARGIKICLDIVLNHSGPFGIKNFAELKYNYPAVIDGKPNTFPVPDEWGSWKYDESKYQAGQSQVFPNNWEYDGLHSPGTKGGTAISPSSGFGAPDLRPFTDADKAQYPDLLTASKYWYDSTMSYCTTIDGKASYGEPNSLNYEQYKASKRRMRGHNTGFPTGSGSFDNFPDAHFDSLHNHCPDLNTENVDLQNYLLNAYYRYIDMGVDMFRVDTVMHIHKETLNNVFWPKLLERAEQSKAARGGAEFLIFGEVANFVSNPTDKASLLREQNYTWDQAHNDVTSNNHLLNGNAYRTPDYSAKAPNASAPGKVSVINMIAHNNFCNGEGGGYGAALNNDRLYNDATYMPWYADSHDYGPNKGQFRYGGDFKPLWSMLFTFRGIPVVYYGSEIRFKQGMPNDWPTPGSAAGTEMSLEKTGRGYYGPHLDGTVSATNFGEYTASGAVATTLNSDESQHLIRLNKIRLAVPALQMGQYSTEGCTGGWAAYKRRYTGTNTITGEKIDSYAVVGVGAGTYNYTGILDGKYIDCVTGDVKQVTGGKLSFTVPGDASNLRVYVLDDLTTKAPGKVIGTATKFIY